MSEGRNDEARERAGFFLRQLRRAGADIEPRTLEFYERVAADPGTAMSDVAFDMEGGAGRRLAEWLDRVRSRPLPAYKIHACGDGDPQAGRFGRRAKPTLPPRLTRPSSVGLLRGRTIVPFGRSCAGMGAWCWGSAAGC